MTSELNNQYPKSLDMIPLLTENYSFILNDIFSTKLIAGEHRYPPNLINIDVFNPHLLPVRDILSPPTSDDESIANNEIPFTDICNSFFDLELLKAVDELNDVPSNAKPAIYIVIHRLDLPEITTAKKICKRLSRNEEHISPIEIILFEDEEGNKYALCKFENKYQCKYIYENIFHSNKEVASYCYDATDRDDSNWFPVIVRNIPLENKRNFEEVYLHKFNDTIDHTFSVTYIGNSLCCMVVMKTIEAAEELCKVLNRKNGMKAHLHYKCCKKRYGRVNYKLCGKKKNHKKKKSNVIDMLLNEQRKIERNNNI